MWFLQISDGLDWIDLQQLADDDEATIARSLPPSEWPDARRYPVPLRVVSRRLLKDGYEDTILKEWPAVTE